MNQNINGRFPNWWQQAVTVENLECRKYNRSNKGQIGEFDFSIIKPSELERALDETRIVAAGRIIQNNHPLVFQERLMSSMLGSLSNPIVQKDSKAIIPHGLIGPHHFVWQANSLEVSDPLLGFDAHIQVFDEGNFYQWEVAQFEIVEGRHYGKWVSEYLDLTDFDRTYDEFQRIMRLKGNQEISDEEYTSEASGFINHLRKIRKEAYSELLHVHEQLKQSDRTSHGKVVNHPPPRLSRFESMKIVDGKMSTICTAAPFFYRATLRHCHQAKILAANTYHPDSVMNLHEIYEERCQAIVMAIICLEAVMNEAGNAKHPNMWGSLEKLNLIEKINFLHTYSETNLKFDTSTHPWQGVKSLNDARNKIVHFKHEYHEVKILNKGRKSITHMEHTLSEDLVGKIPNLIKGSIEKIYTLADQEVPRWLTDQPEWNLSQYL